MKLNRYFVLLVSGIFSACSIAVRTSSDKAPEAAAPKNADVVYATFLQMNDVYEIIPLEDGKFGGMARVATVQRELKKENPNTITVLSGDFISPSAAGTSSFQGKRINGAQMVDAMNSIGVDYVCFGNHEFDLGYEALQDRINQSNFTWISSNIKYTPSTEGEVKAFEKLKTPPPPDPRYPYPFSPSGPTPFPEYVIVNATNASGAEVRIGLIGLCNNNNKPPYMVWEDPFDAARRIVTTLKNKADIIVAITHLSLDDDRKLATLVPEISLIMGGHEHTNMLFKFGETIVSKADANVRTVYIHHLGWSVSKRKLVINSEVKTIDASIPEEPATQKVVNDWMTRAYAGFQDKGFNPERVVAHLREPLDGRESSIRYRQTNLGTAICKSMIAAAKKAKIAIFNSGSVRLDDELKGVITEYDIIRTLPYGGKIIEVEMKARLLQQVIEAGQARPGGGAFPQFAGVAYDTAKKRLLLDGKPVDSEAKLWVIVSDYLFSGHDRGVEFFTKDHRDVLAVDAPIDAADLRRDIRLALIEFLKK